MESVVEVRCPKGSKSILMKMRRDPTTSKRVSVDNTILISCRECTKHARRRSAAKSESTSYRVVHEFSFDGQYLDSFDEPVN